MKSIYDVKVFEFVLQLKIAMQLAEMTLLP